MRVQTVLVDPEDWPTTELRREQDGWRRVEPRVPARGADAAIGTPAPPAAARGLPRAGDRPGSAP